MRTNRLVTAVLLCLLIGPFARGQEDVVTQRAAKLDQLFKHFAANNKFMGAVAVRKGDKQIFHKQYGVIATDPETTPNDETQYRVGSITKTFTAVMVMQLTEEGKLSLDTKLSDFFVQPKNADKITIRQMLGHVAEELLQQYVGEFTSDQIPLKLKVTIKDGKLVVQGSGQPPIPVVATSETEFRADIVGAKLRFEQSEDKTAYDRMTLQQGGAEIKFKKQSK